MYFLITTKYLHLSRLSLWWRSFFRSHFAKSPFKPDELRSPKRCGSYYCKNKIYSLQTPFGPSGPLYPTRGQLL